MLWIILSCTKFLLSENLASWKYLNLSWVVHLGAFALILQNKDFWFLMPYPTKIDSEAQLKLLSFNFLIFYVWFALQLTFPLSLLRTKHSANWPLMLDAGDDRKRKRQVIEKLSASRKSKLNLMLQWMVRILERLMSLILLISTGRTSQWKRFEGT